MELQGNLNTYNHPEREEETNENTHTSQIKAYYKATVI